jgi:N-acylneuraminate cytidylyltransferase
VAGERTVAIVPARQGSKGLPGKNLALIGGLSLVARAVAVARSTPGIDEVVVSSDGADILGAARQAGADADERPAPLAADGALLEDVLLEYLGRRPDVGVVVVLQPTSPLRLPEDIVRCLEALALGADTVTTVAAVPHAAEWLMRIDSEGVLEPVLGWPSFVRRRQEAVPTYSLNGAVYVASARHLLGGGRLVGPSTIGVEMPPERSVDIDDQGDLDRARQLAAPGLDSGVVSRPPGSR